MANPRNATTSKSGSRTYSWRGDKFYSVTTMQKGGLPMGYGLQKWMKYATALGSIQEQDVIQTMLRKCETPDHCQRVVDYKDVCDECTRILDWLAGRPYTLTKKAADIGTVVHEASEAYVLGQPYPEWDDSIRPRMEQFLRFLDDYKPVYEMTEATVYSRTHRYAGTLDAIVRMKVDNTGKKFILDMKSGRGVYSEVAIQLAMYRYAEFIGMPDGSEAPMPKVDGAAALHLTDTGYELIDVQADEEIFRFALHMREIYRWETDVKKHVLRGPLRLGVSPVGPQLTIAEEAS